MIMFGSLDDLNNPELNEKSEQFNNGLFHAVKKQFDGECDKKDKEWKKKHADKINGIIK